MLLHLLCPRNFSVKDFQLPDSVTVAVTVVYIECESSEHDCSSCFILFGAVLHGQGTSNANCWRTCGDGVHIIDEVVSLYGSLWYWWHRCCLSVCVIFDTQWNRSMSELSFCFIKDFCNNWQTFVSLVSSSRHELGHTVCHFTWKPSARCWYIVYCSVDWYIYIWYAIRWLADCFGMQYTGQLLVTGTQYTCQLIVTGMWYAGEPVVIGTQ